MMRECRKTILRCEDTGEELTFCSMTSAGIHINASAKTLRKAQRANRTIRAKNNSVWSVIHIDG